MTTPKIIFYEYLTAIFSFGLFFIVMLGLKNHSTTNQLRIESYIPLWVVTILLLSLLLITTINNSQQKKHHISFYKKFSSLDRFQDERENIANLKSIRLMLIITFVLIGITFIALFLFLIFILGVPFTMNWPTHFPINHQIMIIKGLILYVGSILFISQSAYTFSMLYQLRHI